MPLTPDDVQNKRFTTVRFKEGYDEEEVDAFLDEVESELRRLLSQNSGLRASTATPGATGPAPPAPPPAAADRPVGASPPSEDPSETALRTLLLAQRTADEAVAEARAEAESILDSARASASSMDSQARAQHATALAELQRQRSDLEARIEELRGFERDYRTRLKAYLEGQLRDLDSRAGVPATPSQFTTAPPAASSAAGTGVTQPAAMQRPGSPAATSGSIASSRPMPSAPVPFTRPVAGGSFVSDVDAASDPPQAPPREAGDGNTDSSPGAADG
jgi:DivIVA domain-containing protein